MTESSVVIAAPAAAVWAVYADVERWPEWTASVRSLRALDGPGLAVGKRFEITQPRLPRLVWEVTELAEGSGWTWRQRSPGGLTVAGHELVVTGGGTRVRQWIDQRGPVGVAVGLLMRGLTRRYLAMEAAGLKERVAARS